MNEQFLGAAKHWMTIGELTKTIKARARLHSAKMPFVNCMCFDYGVCVCLFEFVFRFCWRDLKAVIDQDARASGAGNEETNEHSVWK